MCACHADGNQVAGSVISAPQAPTLQKENKKKRKQKKRRSMFLYFFSSHQFEVKIDNCHSFT